MRELVAIKTSNVYYANISSTNTAHHKKHIFLLRSYFQTWDHWIFGNMAAEKSNSKEEKKISAIFEDDDEDFREGMIDRVRLIHEEFDKDKDGFLNYFELRALQYATSQTELTPDQYKMVCEALGCSPSEGLDVESIRLTYASGGGSDIHKDFDTIFTVQVVKDKIAGQNNQVKQKDSDDDDGILEVVDGETIDISK